MSRTIQPCDIFLELRRSKHQRIFYASSACVRRTIKRPGWRHCAEDTVYPAQPDFEYGWEKLFSERLYLSHEILVSARRSGATTTFSDRKAHGAAVKRRRPLLLCAGGGRGA